MANDHEPNAPPSGKWSGFYCYSAGGMRHKQRLYLAFADGRIVGDGDDGVGGFVIAGKYSGANCRWVKSYFSHRVHYYGYWERNSIWGMWEIPRNSRGGFRLWPVDDAEKLADKIEMPEAQPMVFEMPDLSNRTVKCEHANTAGREFCR